jgi:hypothetical protein
MNVRVVVVAVLGLAIASPGDVAGCGDKFLVPSRSARFQIRVADRAAAAVLLYARAGSVFSSQMRALPVEATLRAAGYRPIVLETREAFGLALRGRQWDVVMVDLGDDAAVAAGPGAGRAPAVLPVAYNVPKATLDEARRRHRVVLAAPRRQQAFVDALDRVLATQARQRLSTAPAANRS